MPVVNANPLVIATPSPPSAGGSIVPSSLLPPIDYGSRDYASILQDLTDNIPNFLPEWTSRSASDFGIVLLQCFAWVGDILNYYEDRIANETFLATATQLQSVLNIAEMLDYQPQASVGATVTLTLVASSTLSGTLTIPANSQFATLGTATQGPIVFETTGAATINTPGGSATVAAVQGITQSDESVATSDGTPNQQYSLAYNPVIADSLTVYVDEGYGPQAWQYTLHLIDWGPQDRVYTTTFDASGVVFVIFGDDANGRIPALASPITATYRVGGGSLGNVGPGTVVQPMQSFVGLASVTNASASTGGADAESATSIQQQAPVSLKSVDRAVTVDDFKSLALQVPGVQLATAQASTYQLVNLYVAPYGGGVPPTTLYQAVLNYLAPRRLVNTTVTVLPPTYIPVDITVNVVVLPQYRMTTTQTAIQNALLNLLLLTNVDFGSTISVGAVYSAVMSVTGTQSPQIVLLARDDMTPTPTGVQDAVMGAAEIPVAGTIIVNVSGGIAGS